MKKQINILFVVSSLIKCGPTNQLYGIINHLDKEKFKIRLLTLFSESKKSDLDKFKKLGIAIDSLDVPNNKNYLQTTYKLVKYCKSSKFDLVHSSGLAADFSCCFLSNIIHISTIRNYAKLDYKSSYGKLYTKVMVPLNNWAINNTDFPICCSKSIKVMYEQETKKKLYYIQNGVDTSKYMHKPELKQLVRRSLNLPEDKLIFISSGSLIDRKDPLFIAKAFKKLEMKKNVLLIFIGDGYLFEHCKEYESEYISVRGNVDNVIDYLHASDVFISASKSEGLPNAVLEAASCGLELVLSGIPQHKEIFEKDMQLANFFELNNEMQFEDIVNNIILKEKNLRKNPSDFIQKNFSAQSNSNKYGEFYEWAIMNKPFVKK
ncbi:glycosyltransferase [Bacillus sp. FJAT-45066]|uniref:glycosyltransferase n=1 Tax=Bacillus sp. FJAT-45066 TaxID=2011010 RepID=UPI000BB78736|nr:glycosyltransferase [Bacillus sp. FJAT-45066]